MSVSYQLDPSSELSIFGTNINSPTSFSISPEVDVSPLSSKGSITVDAILTDNERVMITITAYNTSQISSFRVGTAGAVVLRHRPKAGNGSAFTGSVQTITAAAAVLVGISESTPTVGSSEIVYTLMAYNTISGNPIAFT